MALPAWRSHSSGCRAPAGWTRTSLGRPGASYTLGDGHVGAAIMVRASFTADAGNDEELTSSPTAPVEPRRLTAEF